MNRYQALKHAVFAHQGQTDLCGNPYVLHPIAVAEVLETDRKSAVTFDDHEFIVALLHDVLEDTNYRLYPNDFDSGRVEMRALLAITRRKGETYFDYIRRVCKNPVASYVKLADLWHNMQPERADCLEEGVRKGLEKRYLKARGMIWKAIDEEWWPE